MDSRRTVAVALAVVVVLSGLALRPSAARPAMPAPSAPALLTDARTVPAGAPTSPVAPQVPIRIGLTLSYSHPAALAALLAAVEDPRSPDYRQYVSYADFQRSFAPPTSAVDAVRAALLHAGASAIGIPAGSTTVEATVDAAGFRALFGAPPVEFRRPDGSVAFTIAQAPRLPASIAAFVSGAEGLSGSVGRTATTTAGLSGATSVTRTSGLPSFVLDRTSGSEWFVGSDFTQAYQATALLPGNSSVPHASYPYRIAVATLLASGYNLSFSANLPPFDPSVVDQYFSDTFAPGWPMPNLTGVAVPESGSTLPPPPGSYGILTDTTGLETENSLDLEMAGSLAPGASLYNFYFAGSLVENPTALGSIAGYLADDLAAALSHSYGSAVLSVVSCSFGLTDLNNSAWNSELTEAAALGVTVVSASGDQGNAPDVATGRTSGPDPVWPATVAFNTTGVVSVGGVSLSLSGSPTSNYTGGALSVRYDPFVQGLAATTAWFDASAGFGNYAGTEGGVSGVYAEPYWQFHSAAQPNIVTEAELQHVGALGRAGPDIAFPGNTTIAYIAASSGGSPIYALISGTSVAAPAFAGLLADIVAVEGATTGTVRPLGFLDPELYRIASYFAANPGGSDPYVDVLNGSNVVFSALPGWDAVTGWGGLLAPLLLAADENPTISGYVYTGPTPTLPARPLAVFSPLVVVLLVVASGAVVALGIAVYLRRAPRARPPDVFDPFLLPGGSPAPGAVGPPTFATFLCPYCGAARPAEAGPCPSCGIT